MRINKIFFLVFLMATVILTSCASGNRGSKGCGCPQKSGMVGY
jgi:hypothetical protein